MNTPTPPALDAGIETVPADMIEVPRDLIGAALRMIGRHKLPKTRTEDMLRKYSMRPSLPTAQPAVKPVDSAWLTAEDVALLDRVERAAKECVEAPYFEGWLEASKTMVTDAPRLVALARLAARTRPAARVDETMVERVADLTGQQVIDAWNDSGMGGGGVICPLVEQPEPWRSLWQAFADALNAAIAPAPIHALTAERDALRKAGQMVFDGLIDRVQQAGVHGSPAPVFSGLAELSAALTPRDGAK